MINIKSRPGFYKLETTYYKDKLTTYQEQKLLDKLFKFVNSLSWADKFGFIFGLLGAIGPFVLVVL
jgi:hypothetical protein